MKNKKRLLTICLLLFFSGCSFAIVRLPALFADHMVLQQNSEVAIWGWADPGETINISNSWNQRTGNTIADKYGHWLINLPTSNAGGPYVLSIYGKSNRIDLQDVMLGEVGLCSGQSNMEFPLQRQEGWKTGSMNAKEEIEQADYPNLRMFIVQRATAAEPLQDVTGSWNVCNPSTAGKFSAVAYYFGKEIMKQTGMPVGLIHSSWGGTPAEAWTKKEVLESEPDFKPIFERFNKALEDYDKGTKEYELNFKQWLIDSTNARHRGDTISAAPKKPPAVHYYQSPAQLYNAMIAPLVPFTLKGVIWYQGESNAGRAYQYRKLFPAMIKGWRKDWNADFPFYFVQIAPHQGQSPEIREAQLITMKTVPNTGMAVITDAGDSLDIHPRNKEVPGKRLAVWALSKNYGKKNLVYSGPIYRSMK